MLPLLDGPRTPETIEKMLNVFGNNPHGEPRYRLIWSTRKQIYFCGENVREYDAHFDEPRWVLEVWLSPEKDSGPEYAWTWQEAMLGPYPRKGTYQIAEQGEFTYPGTNVPSEEAVRRHVVALEMSRDLTPEERQKGKREALEAREEVAVKTVAGEIEELQDSASMGKIQQAMSGPKNNFRTVDDFERDQWHVNDLPYLPKRGGKILH